MVAISTGIINTFAGTGSASYSGDNGPASAATLSYPAGVSVDSVGTHPCVTIQYIPYLLVLPR